MEKIIKIGNKEIRLNNNVAWTMEYRDQFGRDIVPAIMPLVSAILEMVATVAADATDEEGKVRLQAMGEAIQGRAMDITLPLYQVEFVDTVINVTWAMAKAADESIAPPKQWVRQFDEFPLDVIVPDVGELLLKGFISSKNAKRLGNLKETLKALKTLQPSTSTPSSSPEQSEG